VTGSSPLTPDIAGIGFLAVATGTGALVGRHYSDRSAA
jgi:hypothetical protein